MVYQGHYNSQGGYDQSSQYDNRQIPVNYDDPTPPAREYNSPPQPGSSSFHPGAHPKSHFQQLQAQRQYGVSPAQTSGSPPRGEYRGMSPPRKPVPAIPAGGGDAPPAVPQHAHVSRGMRQSTTSPGQDNLGPAAAGGGVTGLALGVAGANERESGVQAIHGIENWGRPGTGNGGLSGPSERSNDSRGYDSSHSYDEATGRPNIPSYASEEPLAGHPGTPGFAPSPSHSNPNFHAHAVPYGRTYADNPYDPVGSSRGYMGAGAMGMIDPNSIADDGDDGLGAPPGDPKRRSMISLSRLSARNSSTPNMAAAAGAAGAGTAGAGMLGAFNNRDGSGQYGPVPGGSSAPPNSSGFDGEKRSEWLSKQSTGNKKLRIIVGVIIVLVVIGAVAGGVIGGILGKNKSGGGTGGSSGQSAKDDDGKGDLNKNSGEIKALMNNKNLHRVFPGIDYTPLNTQYPDCIHDPPSQNNVTRDVAVLTQLTNTLRLYGTDCNQTEMVLHALDKLEIKDTKLWLGAWVGDNSTTNDRQLKQMWSILDAHGASPFAGVVVGNEVLFRKDQSETAMAKILADTKTQLSAKKLDLPLATSDLGDNWTLQLAQEVDVIMSNIHPFFGGVAAPEAAGWTYSFWQSKDVALTQGLTDKKHVISEVGWPSAGGNDCAPADTCPDKTSGAVASVDNMNLFMSQWVCQSLANGTSYFWFEAFDEPWKLRYNEPEKNKEWEDKWGLMDVNRNLKKGVKIPDCGGKSVG